MKTAPLQAWPPVPTRNRTRNRTHNRTRNRVFLWDFLSCTCRLLKKGLWGSACNAERRRSELAALGLVLRGLAYTIVFAATLATVRAAEAPKAAPELPPPAVWTFPSTPPRIHIARGLWWDYWRLHEAIAHTGGASCEASWEVVGNPHGYGGCGSTLSDFPKTYVELQRYNVIILTGNRAASLPEAVQRRLRLWVENGGGLLMLGSLQTFGSGGWHGSVLEEALPVTVPAEPDFTKADKPRRLEATPAGTALFGPATPWHQAPLVYFYHRGLVPRPDAAVWATADGQPMLVSRSCGKGRVVTFAATVCGDPAAGDMPLWDWDGLPLILAKTIAWLEAPSLAVQPRAAAESAAPPPPPADAAYEAKRAELAKLSEVNVEELTEDTEAAPAKKQARPQFARIRELADSCADTAYGLAVVRALAESGSPFPARDADALHARLRPYLNGPEFKAPALLMAETNNSGQVALGLRLLGHVKAAECRKLLPPILARGLAALNRGGAPVVGMPDGDDEYLRLAAVLAVTDAGDPALLDAVRAARFPPEEDGNPLNMVRAQLAESAMVARCLLGDSSAAVPLVRAVIKNRFEFEAALDETQTWRSGPTSKETTMKIQRCAASLPGRRARIRELQEYCIQMPAGALPGVAAASAEWQGEFAMECLLATLARSGERAPATEVLQQVLKTSPIPEVRALCVDRLLAAAPQTVGPALTELARGDAERASFALRQLPWLPSDQREPVWRAALQHPEPAVRAKATACQAGSQPK